MRKYLNIRIALLLLIVFSGLSFKFPEKAAIKNYDDAVIIYANVSSSGLSEEVINRISMLIDSASHTKAKTILFIRSEANLQIFESEKELESSGYYLSLRNTILINPFDEIKAMREVIVKEDFRVSKNINFHFALSDYCYSSMMNDVQLSVITHIFPLQVSAICGGMSNVNITGYTTESDKKVDLKKLNNSFTGIEKNDRIKYQLQIL